MYILINPNLFYFHWSSLKVGKNNFIHGVGCSLDAVLEPLFMSIKLLIKSHNISRKKKFWYLVFVSFYMTKEGHEWIELIGFTIKHHIIRGFTTLKWKENNYSIYESHMCFEAVTAAQWGTWFPPDRDQNEFA